MIPTEIFEYSKKNTSCYVCGIGGPGLRSKKCSPMFEGDLMETNHLIEASNALLKTNNSFQGCLTIFENGGKKVL